MLQKFVTGFYERSSKITNSLDKIFLIVRSGKNLINVGLYFVNTHFKSGVY